MVHYTGIVPVFHIQINWNFVSMAIAFLAAIHRQLFTIYQIRASHNSVAIGDIYCDCCVSSEHTYIVGDADGTRTHF